jgi:hypothetical protein
LIYQTLANNLESFLAERRAEDPDAKPLPQFVEKEMRAFLSCGILSAGFVLLKCEEGCGGMFAVPYSCKRRGFCSSCSAKRMHETAIHLTENVLPQVPFRQWVATFPFALRSWMAASRQMTSIVHRVVTKMIASYYLHQAEDRGIIDAQPGGMTFVQRFGGALNIAPHLHVLMIEGVYSLVEDKPVFYHLPGPSDEEVGQVLEAVAHAVVEMLRSKGLLAEEGQDVDASRYIDKVFAESALLTSATQASGRMRIAFGEHVGQRVRRIGRSFGFAQEVPLIKGPRCALINGFSLHANRYIGQQERDKLRDLICYGARGAFSNERLSLKNPANPDGDLVYRLRHVWADGTEAVELSQMEFLEKLVALIPPPNSHLTRYHGALSSHSKIRPLIILKPGFTKGFVTELGATDEEMIVRLTWSRLMRKTFKRDVMVCPACGARIRSKNCIAVNEASSIQRILRYLGQNEHPPPIKPARRTIRELDFDQRQSNIVH